MREIKYDAVKIDGDYVHLKDIETGDEILVAMALLPEETDEGIKLLYKDFEYSVIK